MTDFEKRNIEKIKAMSNDKALLETTKKWFLDGFKYEYSYHFKWLGLPIIQYPQDIIALQEIIWKAKPDMIIETGIARGGSLIFYASILELIGKGSIIGIDIKIHKNNRKELEKHPFHKRIHIIEGSSVNRDVIRKVRELAKNKKRIMVILDSNHSHQHVLKELKLYSSFVTKGSYLVVFDTIIEDMPDSFCSNRPWKKGNSPKSAVKEFLKTNDRFRIDHKLENKLLITVAPSGYLKCIKNN